jgi:hypothetical protein
MSRDGFIQACLRADHLCAAIWADLIHTALASHMRNLFAAFWADTVAAGARARFVASASAPALTGVLTASLPAALAKPIA